MFSSLWQSLQTTVGRIAGTVISIIVIVTIGLVIWRVAGPDLTDPNEIIPVSKPPVPPIFGDETVAVRPDSAGGWTIDHDIEGNFDATLTIAYPDTSEGGGESYVQIGITERARQFFPEFPGRSKLPVSARIIGGGESARVRLVEQSQPVFDLALQTEYGIGFAPGAVGKTGLTVGVTGLRAYGVRMGGFAYAGAGAENSRFEIALRAGPYVSSRVYGPIGIGLGKDVLHHGRTLSGWVASITVDL